MSHLSLVAGQKDEKGVFLSSLLVSFTAVDVLALMQLADFCPAWFVEVTEEFLQASWQLWPSQSGGAESPEQRW